MNEAFAAQWLAVMQQAGLDASKVKPTGGAIALGHPLGCTGAKLTATILRELARRGGRYGMVTMCIGGGVGAGGGVLGGGEEREERVCPTAQQGEQGGKRKKKKKKEKTRKKDEK